jgi:hypothetical protein
VVPLIVLAVAALTAAAVAVWRVRRLRRLYRVLARETAAYRLTEGCRDQDYAAFHVQIEELLAQRAVLSEADRVLDGALAIHHYDPEGGSA